MDHQNFVVRSGQHIGTELIGYLIQFPDGSHGQGFILFPQRDHSFIV